MEMEQLVALCKRRGFLFQSSEIYGGLQGFWDYGPMGVELKRNVREAWWHDMLTAHNELEVPAGAPSSYEMAGLDCSIDPLRCGVGGAFAPNAGLWAASFASAACAATSSIALNASVMR